MRFQVPTLLTSGLATLSLVLPIFASPAASDPSVGTPSERPAIKYQPKSPSKAPYIPQKRCKLCYVKSHNDGVTDDSEYVLKALRLCNNGGQIVFKKDLAYTIGTALDLTFLKHVDIGMWLEDVFAGPELMEGIDIQSNIKFTNDTTYWQANSFRFGFQNVTSFFKLGGNDVQIYGGGTVDGNGQAWYDLYASNIYALRPVLFGIDGLHDSAISNLVLRYSPEYYFFVANSTNVVFDSLDIAGGSKNANPAKNTDGWDTYRSSGITIQNSIINNGDDCVSFKPNSTDILVQNLHCNGSHGISVGSLGQYPGAYDIVENIYVYNTSLTNATDGARIKVWPNAPSALSGDLQGGGGEGRVNNVTYDTMFIDNTDYAIEITQCYGQKNLTLCLEFPSRLTISNILFKNFSGKTSKKYSPLTSTFACSNDKVCNAIAAQDIKVLSPDGTRDAYCLNVDKTQLDVNCTTTSKGFN